MNTKNWKYKLLTVRKDLRVIFVICLISVPLIDLWLINVPGFFPGAAYLGKIYYIFCISYVPGFILYFLTVHLPSEKNKVKSIKLIHQKCVNINKISICLIASMRLANKQFPRPNDSLKDEEELSTLCKGINPSQIFHLYIPYNRTFEHWSECMVFFSKEIKDIVQELLIIRDYIDSELMVVLTEIDVYLDELNCFKGTKSGNKDITSYYKPIKGLCDSSDKLYEILRSKYHYHNIEVYPKYPK